MSNENQSQPPQQQVYDNPGNPVSKEPAESNQPGSHNIPSNKVVESRDAHDHQSGSGGANPSPLARGIRGAGPGESKDNSDQDDEKMGPPGEGKVADAVRRKPGATGSEPSLTANLDQKKAEQQGKRDEIKADRAAGFDVGGQQGQTGGPANPVQD